MSEFPEIPSFRVGDILTESAKGFAKIIWRDGLLPRIKQGPKRVADASWITAQYMAPRVENYMKKNAPWTDRTSAARNGLAARAYRDGSETGIVAYHQVPYGIWLEVRWEGKYGIILNTIDEMGPEVMARYERLLERI